MTQMEMKTHGPQGAPMDAEINRKSVIINF